MASIYDTLTKGLSGTPARNELVPLGYSQGQMGAIDQLRNLGLQGLQQGLPSFTPIREKATADFQEYAQPRIGQNADNLLGGNASNPFLSQLMSQNAFRGLQRDLSAQESNFNQSNFNNLMSALRLGLTPMHENVRIEEQPGFLDNLRESGAASAFPAFLDILKNFGGGTDLGSGGQPKWLQNLIGAVGSGATGATAGSVFGPIGTGIGGGLGLLLSLASTIFGSKGKGSKQNVTPFGQGPEKFFLGGK